MKENLMEESNNRIGKYMIGFRILFQQILQLQMFLAGKMALTDFTSLPKYSMLRKAFGTCFQKQ